MVNKIKAVKETAESKQNLKITGIQTIVCSATMQMDA